MDNRAREILKELVAQYGHGVNDDPVRCEGLLRDYAGKHRKEINIILFAHKFGVPKELSCSQGGMPIEVVISRLTRTLKEEHSLTEEAACWAVESWAIALGMLSADRAGQLNPANGIGGTPAPVLQPFPRIAAKSPSTDSAPAVTPFVVLTKAMIKKYSTPLTPAATPHLISPPAAATMPNPARYSATVSAVPDAVKGPGCAAALLGIILSLVALGLLISLASYAETDPPNGTAEVKNLCGTIGAHLAHGLLFTTGYASYLLLAWIAMAAYRRFQPAPLFEALLEAAGFVLGILGLALLLSRFNPMAGGFLGDYLAARSGRWLGNWGSILVGLVGLLSSIVLVAPTRRRRLDESQL